jgi:hypothetical protein
VVDENVAQLIERLKNMDQTAKVCIASVDGDDTSYFSMELCTEVKNTEYVNDAGNYVTGNIVSLYG